MRKGAVASRDQLKAIAIQQQKSGAIKTKRIPGQSIAGLPGDANSRGLFLQLLSSLTVVWDRALRNGYSTREQIVQDRDALVSISRTTLSCVKHLRFLLCRLFCAPGTCGGFRIAPGHEGPVKAAGFAGR